jgi:opacity protein-like surface antigen
MRKRNSWIAALAAAAVLIAVQTAQAGSVADGAYIGIQGGYGAAVVDASTTNNGDGKGKAYSFQEGGIGMDGGSFGAFMGYGFRMGALYVGAEVSSNWSEMEFDPGQIKIDLDRSPGVNKSENNEVTGGSAKLAYTGTVSGRFGYYVNPSTLFSLSGGLSGSQFDVKWGGYAEEYWDPGVTYGVGLESNVADGLAVRISWNITDYYDAEVFGIGSITESSGDVSVEIQPTMSVAHLGLLYTF